MRIKPSTLATRIDATVPRPIAAALCAAALTSFPAFAPAATPDDQTYAPTTLTAAQVLQRARAARGKLDPGAYEIVSKRHGGGMDSVVTTYIDGNDSLSTETSGPFATSWGVYDGQSWTSDENGVVTLNSNFSAHDDPDRLALANVAEDSSVTILGETTGAQPAYAIDVHPKNGAHQIRYYDATSFLPTRVVSWGVDRMKHVVTYESYATAFGQTTPRRSHYSDGVPDDDFDSTVVSLRRATNVPPLAIPPSASLFSFPSDKPVALPAVFNRGSIIVRLTINGRGLDFLFDSGSSGIFIDPGVAHELGLKTYGRVTGTIGGNFDESRTIVPDVSVGDLHMKNVEFGVAPISDNYPLVKVVGLLGYDFIASAIIGADYGASTLTAYPHGSSPTQEVVSKVPVDLDDGVPRAAASFEGVPGNFLVDTGAFATMIYPRYFDRLPNRSNLKGTEGVAFVGGTVRAAQYRIYDLDFGGVLFRNADVIVPQSSLADGDDYDDYDGIIGRDVLIGYTIYFDYAGQALYVRYTE